jgi:hypothetical protein
MQEGGFEGCFEILLCVDKEIVQEIEAFVDKQPVDALYLDVPVGFAVHDDRIEEGANAGKEILYGM